MRAQSEPNALDLDAYNLSLVTAKEDILNQRVSTDWAVFTYERRWSLKLLDSGVGGLEELTKKFNKNLILYGLCQAADPGSPVPRFILVHWVGENVDATRREICMQHLPAIRRFFKEASVMMRAQRLEDITPEAVAQALSKVPMPTRSFHKPRFPGSHEVVGTNYTKTNPAIEMKFSKRESFWQRNEREEERRKEMERLRLQEERIAAERERVERERLEEEERERRIQEKERMVEEQRKEQARMEAEQRRTEKARWAQQQKEFEEEMRGRIRRSQSIEMAAEAAALVSNRSLHPRDFFRQQERSVSCSFSPPSTPSSPLRSPSSFSNRTTFRYQRSMTETIVTPSSRSPTPTFFPGFQKRDSFSGPSSNTPPQCSPGFIFSKASLPTKSPKVESLPSFIPPPISAPRASQSHAKENVSPQRNLSPTMNDAPYRAEYVTLAPEESPSHNVDSKAKARPQVLCIPPSANVDTPDASADPCDVYRAECVSVESLSSQDHNKYFPEQRSSPKSPGSFSTSEEPAAIKATVSVSTPVTEMSFASITPVTDVSTSPGPLSTGPKSPLSATTIPSTSAPQEVAPAPISATQASRSPDQTAFPSPAISAPTKVDFVPITNGDLFTPATSATAEGLSPSLVTSEAKPSSLKSFLQYVAPPPYVPFSARSTDSITVKAPLFAKSRLPSLSGVLPISTTKSPTVEDLSAPSNSHLKPSMKSSEFNDDCLARSPAEVANSKEEQPVEIPSLSSSAVSSQLESIYYKTEVLPNDNLPAPCLGTNEDQTETQTLMNPISSSKNVTQETSHLLSYTLSEAPPSKSVNTLSSPETQDRSLAIQNLSVSVNLPRDSPSKSHPDLSEDQTLFPARSLKDGDNEDRMDVPPAEPLRFESLCTDLLPTFQTTNSQTGGLPSETVIVYSPVDSQNEPSVNQTDAEPIVPVPEVLQSEPLTLSDCPANERLSEGEQCQDQSKVLLSPTSQDSDDQTQVSPPDPSPVCLILPNQTEPRSQTDIPLNIHIPVPTALSTYDLSEPKPDSDTIQSELLSAEAGVNDSQTIGSLSESRDELSNGLTMGRVTISSIHPTINSSESQAEVCDNQLQFEPLSLQRSIPFLEPLPVIESSPGTLIVLQDGQSEVPQAECLPQFSSPTASSSLPQDDQNEPGVFQSLPLPTSLPVVASSESIDRYPKVALEQDLPVSVSSPAGSSPANTTESSPLSFKFSAEPSGLPAKFPPPVALHESSTKNNISEPSPSHTISPYEISSSHLSQVAPTENITESPPLPVMSPPVFPAGASEVPSEVPPAEIIIESSALLTISPPEISVGSSEVPSEVPLAESVTESSTLPNISPPEIPSETLEVPTKDPTDGIITESSALTNISPPEIPAETSELPSEVPPVETITKSFALPTLSPPEIPAELIEVPSEVPSAESITESSALPTIISPEIPAELIEVPSEVPSAESITESSAIPTIIPPEIPVEPIELPSEVSTAECIQEPSALPTIILPEIPAELIDLPSEVPQAESITDSSVLPTISPPEIPVEPIKLPSEVPPAGSTPESSALPTISPPEIPAELIDLPSEVPQAESITDSSVLPTISPPEIPVEPIKLPSEVPPAGSTPESSALPTISPPEIPVEPIKLPSEVPPAESTPESSSLPTINPPEIPVEPIELSSDVPPAESIPESSALPTTSPSKIPAETSEFPSEVPPPESTPESDALPTIIPPEIPVEPTELPSEVPPPESITESSALPTIIPPEIPAEPIELPSEVPAIERITESSALLSLSPPQISSEPIELPFEVPPAESVTESSVLPPISPPEIPAEPIELPSEVPPAESTPESSALPTIIPPEIPAEPIELPSEIQIPPPESITESSALPTIIPPEIPAETSEFPSEVPPPESSPKSSALPTINPSEIPAETSVLPSKVLPVGSIPESSALPTISPPEIQAEPVELPSEEITGPSAPPNICPSEIPAEPSEFPLEDITESSALPTINPPKIPTEPIELPSEVPPTESIPESSALPTISPPEIPEAHLKFIELPYEFPPTESISELSALPTISPPEIPEEPNELPYEVPPTESITESSALPTISPPEIPAELSELPPSISESSALPIVSPRDIPGEPCELPSEAITEYSPVSTISHAEPSSSQLEVPPAGSLTESSQLPDVSLAEIQLDFPDHPNEVPPVENILESIPPSDVSLAEIQLEFEDHPSKMPLTDTKAESAEPIGPPVLIADASDTRPRSDVQQLELPPTEISSLSNDHSAEYRSDIPLPETSPEPLALPADLKEVSAVGSFSSDIVNSEEPSLVSPSCPSELVADPNGNLIVVETFPDGYQHSAILPELLPPSSGETSAGNLSSDLVPNPNLTLSEDPHPGSPPVNQPLHAEDTSESIASGKVIVHDLRTNSPPNTEENGISHSVPDTSAYEDSVPVPNPLQTKDNDVHNNNSSGLSEVLL